MDTGDVSFHSYLDFIHVITAKKYTEINELVLGHLEPLQHLVQVELLDGHLTGLAKNNQFISQLIY